MRGIRTTILKTICLLSAAAGVCAAASDYFPLQEGNSWVYKVTQGRMSRPGAINVGARQTIEGREYFRVSFFEDPIYLREGANGALLKYDPETKQEGVWLPFGVEPGSPTNTNMDPCSRIATLESVNAKVTTALGDFSNAAHVVYQPNCADAGVVQQYFLPYVGMILHETSSIAGPVRYELVYSRTGMTNIDVQANAFTLSTDAPVYKAGADALMLARVTLRATEPVKLTFPSGQTSDLRIRNDKGDVVYAWSADKLFPQALQEILVENGDRSWVMEAPLGNLAPGRYTAEAWLTTQPQKYSAVVTFDIVR